MKPVVLLDGGMGQELIARSKRKPDPLWSARVMMDEPEIVQAVHADYLRAGARVITINAYSATPERLERAGFPELFEKLQQQAISLAVAAREETGLDALIAGCLPPLVASYRPDVGPPLSTALEIYRRIVAEQAEKVDIMLCETLASLNEVRAAATAAADSGRPFWVSVTLKDGAHSQLRSGEALSEAIAISVDCGADAVLANCSWPETIGASLDRFAATRLPFGVYANGFTSVEPLLPGGTVETLHARSDLDPHAYASWALECVKRGASIVGGCCEVGPAHIAATRDLLEASGHKIVKVPNA